MTLLFDVRIASDNAKMGVIFPRVGLMSELGSSYLMPRLIGLSRTAEMMLTGRQYTAQECLAMGLVSRVAPQGGLVAATQELAGEMLQCSPTSLAYTRRAIYSGLDGTLDPRWHSRASRWRNACQPRAQGIRDRVPAKRKPDFRGLKRR